MHFGLQLKKRGVISAEQLVEALELQLSTLVPIGQLALEEGMLAPRDIFNILRAQSDAPNLRFGDMAVEMGLMMRDGVIGLLVVESDRIRPIADILVGQGVLTSQQLETELAAYRRAQVPPKQALASMKFIPMRFNKDERPVAEAMTAI